MIMDRLKVLRLYLATRMHFTTKSYDIFKYKAAVKNCNEKTLSSHPGRRVLIERLAKRFKTPGETMGFLVPQWVYSHGDSLYDPIMAEENYNRWQKFKFGSDYHIHSELSGWDLKELIMGEEPKILKLVSQGSISIESAIALQKVKPYIDESKDYFIYNTLCNTIVKSVNFIKCDEEALRVEYETA